MHFIVLVDVVCLHGQVIITNLPNNDSTVISYFIKSVYFTLYASCNKNNIKSKIWTNLKTSVLNCIQ